MLRTERSSDTSASGEIDLPAYFQPSAAEGLKTGSLPTVCCMEDIQAGFLGSSLHKRQQYLLLLLPHK